MKYKIKDLQGAGLKEGYIFQSKAEVIENLADFHNQDWTDEVYPSIYDVLKKCETEQEKLDFLCEHGQWEVYEIEDWEAVLELIEDTENEDENLARLQNAMEYFCGTWDMCEGYKHALKLTIRDQYQNHKDEQDPKDLEKLQAILTAK